MKRSESQNMMPSMKIGTLTVASDEQLDWARGLGFQSTEWVRFADSPAARPSGDWKGFARRHSERALAKGIRISAIAAYYANPLDPPQQAEAVRLIRRAIEVAACIGVPTVSAFAGSILETRMNLRGGNPEYVPLENHLPEVVAFWGPLLEFAAHHGVRIAFEHCPQTANHLPVMSYNLMARPSLWERFFDASTFSNVGIEWDPAHLVCQFIDPLENLRQFGSRIFHVHAKDAYVDLPLMAKFGITHPGVLEHRLPGFGQSDWAQIIHGLLRCGYDSDLNIEGRHDPVLRDHGQEEGGPLAGEKYEEGGLIAALKHLEQFVPLHRVPA